MMKLHKLFPLFLLVVLAQSCQTPVEPTENGILEFLPRNIERVSDGLYSLTIDTTKWQTIYRIDGTLIRDDGKLFAVEQRIEFSSSHVWSFRSGDTIMTIIRRNVDFRGRWVNVDTSIVVTPDDIEVPTINSWGYSNLRGEFSVVIAPIKTMRGDTMTVFASHTPFRGDVATKSIRIVLR
jgi:hypothetical protein